MLLNYDMIFTVYYMAATFVQSWRLKTFLQKIGKQVSETSVIFYRNPECLDGLCILILGLLV